MSVRSNGSGDNLLSAASLGISTGAFSYGSWAKLIDDRNTFVDFMALGDAAAGAATYFSAATDSDGTTSVLFASTTGANGGALTVGTWYWIVVSRDGSGNVTFRVFDDTTSTTPVYTDSGNDGSADYSALDNVIIGEAFSGEWPDAEFANAKVHVGVAWTDAQCRTESQNFEVQTGGGTVFGSWRLEDVDNDTNGILDGSGAGHNLTNTGLITGASRPSQLEAVGGGGGSAPMFRGA